MTAFDPAALRAEMDAAEELAYLDHAAVAPLPRSCRREMDRYLDELSRYGAAHYPGVIVDALDRVRTRGAALLETRPERVFVVRSTSQGLSIPATGLSYREGDNVVLVEREFPANLRPWVPLRKRGVELRLVSQQGGRVRLDDLAAAVDARTRAVSVSFVQFLSGFRIAVAAVAEICRRHDALFVLDAIQGLGVMPLSVEADGVDFLSADAHKWMLGPEGVGLGYASPRALERIEPAVQGWLSVADPWALFDLEQPLRPDAARYEEGAPNTAGLFGLAGSLSLLLDAGVAALSARVLELSERVAEVLANAGFTVRSPRETPGERSGIVSASREGTDLSAPHSALLERGVAVSVREGLVRVSAHAYNDEEDLARLGEALRGW